MKLITLIVLALSMTIGAYSQANAQTFSNQFEDVIPISRMNEVVVEASVEELEEGISKQKVFKLKNCLDDVEGKNDKSCYIVAKLQQGPPNKSEDSISAAANSGTLSCTWEIHYGPLLLAIMKMNVNGNFHVTDFRAPLTWTSGNQAGTTNIFWGASWSELSGVSTTPGFGTRSGNSASAWAQAKLNVSGGGISVVDRVLSQTLNVNTSTATCVYNGW